MFREGKKNQRLDQDRPATERGKKEGRPPSPGQSRHVSRKRISPTEGRNGYSRNGKKKGSSRARDKKSIKRKRTRSVRGGQKAGCPRTPNVTRLEKHTGKGGGGSGRGTPKKEKQSGARGEMGGGFWRVSSRNKLLNNGWVGRGALGMVEAETKWRGRVKNEMSSMR